MSLFSEIGGEAAVNAAVDIFYRKVLKDERINRFFEGVDMVKQAITIKALLFGAFYLYAQHERTPNPVLPVSCLHRFLIGGLFLAVQAGHLLPSHQWRSSLLPARPPLPEDGACGDRSLMLSKHRGHAPW